MLNMQPTPAEWSLDSYADACTKHGTGAERVRPLLLVVDDDELILKLVERLAAAAGYNVVTCTSGSDALSMLTRRPADVAMVDLRMPDVNGLELLRQIRGSLPDCEVILMTGYAGVDSAIEAIKLGAREYLSKPFDLDRIRQLLGDIRGEVERRALLEADVVRPIEYCGMLGRSPVMHEVFSLIQRLAPHAKVALIMGETGTGKGLAARAFHQSGPRNTSPFITIDCSAVVGNSFESELFGHVHGAFSGAVDAKQGLFEKADGGTLFLDEIGELPLPVQAKLLRTLDHSDVQRVGSLQVKHVDVVVIAATKRDLRAEVAAGRFRRDLFSRLDVVEVNLPPLRDRREDIPYLSAAFLRECAQRAQKPIAALTTSAESLLLSAPWDGNVRELKNVIERACLVGHGSMISERELVGALGWASGAPPARVRSVEPSRAPKSDGVVQLEEIERVHIVDVLRQVNGNRVAAAKLLGISRRSLYRRLARHQITGKAPGRPARGRPV
jgi:DNA-binding NtrC family response regulator